MAELFLKQAKQYSDSRPSYPLQLLRFMASKTYSHQLAWDVGTGSGQAAQSNVIGTDASEKQLEFAVKLPNVRYKHTPSTMSMAELEQKVAPEGTVDVVTIAQTLHWFDFPKGVELLKEDVVGRFKSVWTEDGSQLKVAKFPVYLRIGRVGDV